MLCISDTDMTRLAYLNALACHIAYQWWCFKAVWPPSSQQSEIHFFLWMYATVVRFSCEMLFNGQAYSYYCRYYHCRAIFACRVTLQTTRTLSCITIIISNSGLMCRKISQSPWKPGRTQNATIEFFLKICHKTTVDSIGPIDLPKFLYIRLYIRL